MAISFIFITYFSKILFNKSLTNVKIESAVSSEDQG